MDSQGCPELILGPGTWDLPVTGEGLAPEGRVLGSIAASLTRDPE